MNAVAVLRVPQPSLFEAAFSEVSIDGIAVLEALVDGDRCLSLRSVVALINRPASDVDKLRRMFWTQRVDLNWYLVSLRTPGVSLDTADFVRTAGLRVICKALSQRQVGGIQRWLHATARHQLGCVVGQQLRPDA